MKANSVKMSALVLALGMSGPAFAGGYVGGGIGQSTVDSGSCGANCDDEDTGFKLFGGYNLNENFAVEGSYTDFGEVTDGGDTTEATSFAITGVGTLPLGNDFSLFGKLGIAFWDADSSDGGGADGEDVTYGIGVGYSLSDTMDLRGEWERVDASADGTDIDVDLLSINFVWKF